MIDQERGRTGNLQPAEVERSGKQLSFLIKNQVTAGQEPAVRCVLHQRLRLAATFWQNSQRTDGSARDACGEEHTSGFWKNLRPTMTGHAGELAGQIGERVRSAAGAGDFVEPTRAA